MPDAVYVRPMGGLGNQLFIYAAGMALAKRLGTELMIRTDWYMHNHDRELELTEFAYEGTLISKGSLIDKGFRSRKIPLKGQELITRVSGVNLIQESGHFFDSRFADASGSVELRGYFQSWRYFQNVESDLSDQLLAPRSTPPAFLDLQSKLHQLGEWTAIHVRCGDFLDPALRGLHGETKVEYYERALHHLSDLHGDRSVVVFSDDPDCARQNLRQLGVDALFLDLNEELRPVHWLNLMAGARTMICANSSFSWWGAWLAERVRADTIICPRPWFADPNLSERDLLPVSWLTLGRLY